MNEALLLFGGVLSAIAGAELLIRGTAGLARAWRLSATLLASTLSALGTSTPELAVGLRSAWAGVPELSVGDLLGSNVFDIAMIIPFALMFQPLQIPAETRRRDIPAAVLIGTLAATLLLDARLDHLDALALLSGLALWIAVLSRDGRRDAGTEDENWIDGSRLAAASLVSGLALLALSSWAIVVAARSAATILDIDSFTVGETLVAVGTSAPELAILLVSRWRSAEGIGIGTVVGSSIINTGLIMPVVVMIQPLQIDPLQPLIALGCATFATALLMPLRGNLLSRRRAAILLAIYASYLGAAWQL